MNKFSLFLCALCAATAMAAIGVDVSQLFPVSSWECLAGKGYEFAIIRCYCSTGNVDSKCVNSVANAWEGGMKHVDLYMFPCPKCGNHRDQVLTLYNHTVANGVKFGQVWIDIEGIGTYWGTDMAENIQIFETLMNAATEIFGDKFAGIYCSKRSWNGIFGEDYKGWGHLQLWYALWNNAQNHDAWVPYGNFTQPTIHQYQGDVSICDMNVDYDWYA